MRHDIFEFNALGMTWAQRAWRVAFLLAVISVLLMDLLGVAPMKRYNPNWPFPQYDENGKQLLPADWNKRQPKPNHYPTDCEDALL